MSPSSGLSPKRYSGLSFQMIDNFFLYSAIISTGLMSIPKTRYPTLTNDFGRPKVMMVMKPADRGTHTWH